MPETEIPVDAYVRATDSDGKPTIMINVWVSPTDDPDHTVIEVSDDDDGSYVMITLSDAKLSELLDALRAAEDARERVRAAQ